MESVNLAREDADSRKVRSAPPKLSGHQIGQTGIWAKDVQQNVIFIVVRGEERGVRGPELGQQCVDLAKGIFCRGSREDSGTEGLGAFSPIEPLQQCFIKKFLFDGVDNGVIELGQ